ncbi:hypothetical protein ACFLIM_38820 [Nonomuraea sp. M3C6]|uniref:Uncharacterized protein n=2 Tax=Nonomuraea marmarensis TaxID=3351344 RepID=A0ABW7AP34_9ACTN
MLNEVARVTPTGRKTLSTARKSFMAGFASRVGEKLREANKAATSSAAHVEGRSTDLVLRDRKAAVDDYFDRMTPNTGNIKARKVGDTAAYYAGREAGDRADLGGTRVGSGGQRALNA